ncbi:RNA repair domain-containing protein [Desulfurococcus mucosus]|uniref:MJ1316 RNA cyclic group end recognition domain-containing protein n=1 Tax=Desulfurococcus mucosus (strain ATCC 35584 / DSM 2162 / JCM 9187 / O7/1) TaxID=765177 RepID=E8R731_DESM0|nr:RNA repair domain-containing protein [Desulfurococcus mucosus]ADV64464.1 protein of unknown function DUF504 [Desulfurococcus mucosus DSM 2162]
MGRRRGELENWLRRIVFGGRRSDYTVYVRFRTENGEVLKPIPGSLIEDFRGGYIYTRDEVIPLHRVEEIRDSHDTLVYRRSDAGKKHSL